MATSLDDILTATKNIATGLSTLATAVTREQGNATSVTVTVATLITAKPGYLVSFSLVVPGSADGAIYNTTATGTAAAVNKLVTVRHDIGTTADDPSAGANIVHCGVVFNAGLVVSPGTGQSINVTYYQ